MRNVQGEDNNRLLAPILVSASHHEEEDGSTPPSPLVGLQETARTKQDWEDAIHGSYNVRVWMMRVLPCEKNLQQRAEVSHMLIVPTERSRWYICVWTAEPVQFKEFNISGERNEGGAGVCLGSLWAKPQLRESINSKLVAKQHDP